MMLGAGQGCDQGVTRRVARESRWSPRELAARRVLCGAHEVGHRPAPVCAPLRVEEG